MRTLGLLQCCGAIACFVAMGSGCRAFLGIEESIEDRQGADSGVDGESRIATLSDGSAFDGATGSSIVGPGLAGFAIPADAPSGIYDKGESTVVDRVTGLMWERASSGFDSWTDAWARCNDSTTGSHTDWRMPTRLELTTLLDLEAYNGIDASFSSEAYDELWTDSAVSSGLLKGDDKFVDHHWGAIFQDVRLGVQLWKSSQKKARHRCVRGRAAIERLSYELAGDVAKVVGAHWSISRHVESPATFAGATQVCASSRLDGQKDWRLASVKELLAIVDDSRVAPPLVEPLLFLNEIPDALLWTTSTGEHFSSNATTTLNFHDGAPIASGATSASTTRPFICVRRD